MKRICVFCGSSPGSRPEYAEAARHLGVTLAENDIGLVYGGADVGMMGAIASSVIATGGSVTGIIPRQLADQKVAFTGLADLRIVDSMHQRKALMEALSDGFIALPGGLGTIEEFFEIWTWAQLNMHRKPCGLLNVCHYFDRLLAFLDHTVEEQFVEIDHRRMIIVEKDPLTLIERFRTYQPPVTDKAKWALKMNNS
ncbi:TIGR00730 family Rossman fold protein [bacterium]|nr:TIGR00730 family Rossman fold protein [bacterium]